MKVCDVVLCLTVGGKHRTVHSRHIAAPGTKILDQNLSYEELWLDGRKANYLAETSFSSGHLCLSAFVNAKSIMGHYCVQVPGYPV